MQLGKGSLGESLPMLFEAVQFVLGQLQSKLMIHLGLQVQPLIWWHESVPQG
jgi:hypothetical protein